MALELDGQRLEAGERVLWSGRPRQGIVFRAVDAILIPFSLIWMGIVLVFSWYVLMETNSIPASGDGLLPLVLVGGAFVLAALYMVVGRFLTDWMRRAHTSYVVTDRRVLINYASWPHGLTSLDLKHLPNLRLDESSAGRGTIEFYDTASVWRGTRIGVWHATIAQPPKLFEIEDARHVYAIIRRESERPAV